MTTRPTPEQARAYAEAFIAWSEGKSTQMRNMAIAYLGVSWQPFDGFYRSGWEYRIVPDPPKAREWWVNVYPNKFDAAYLSKAVAENQAGNNRLECVHVREILDTEIVVNKAKYEELRRNEAALKAGIKEWIQDALYKHGAKL
jgi:hypothetical protein